MSSVVVSYHRVRLDRTKLTVCQVCKTIVYCETLGFTFSWGGGGVISTAQSNEQTESALHLQRAPYHAVENDYNHQRVVQQLKHATACCSTCFWGLLVEVLKHAAP